MRKYYSVDKFTLKTNSDCASESEKMRCEWKTSSVILTKTKTKTKLNSKIQMCRTL